MAVTGQHTIEEAPRHARGAQRAGLTTDGGEGSTGAAGLKIKGSLEKVALPRGLEPLFSP